MEYALNKNINVCDRRRYLLCSRRRARPRGGSYCSSTSRDQNECCRARCDHRGSMVFCDDFHHYYKFLFFFRQFFLFFLLLSSCSRFHCFFFSGIYHSFFVCSIVHLKVTSLYLSPSLSISRFLIKNVVRLLSLSCKVEGVQLKEAQPINNSLAALFQVTAAPRSDRTCPTATPRFPATGLTLGSATCSIQVRPLLSHFVSPVSRVSRSSQYLCSVSLSINISLVSPRLFLHCLVSCTTDL